MLIIKKIHLYLGLICGVIASLSGLSGALYLWQPELSAAFNPEILLTNNKAQISEETIHQTAFELYGKYGDSLSAIRLPYREQKSIGLIFTNGSTYFFHPATGAALGRKTASMRFFEGLLNFHRTLAIPGFGKYIVGGSAVLFFSLLLASGCYLWWNRYLRKFSSGLAVRTKRGKMTFTYDLHKVFGIVFLMPLMVIAISGSFFTFSSSYKALLRMTDNLTMNTAIAPDIEKESIIIPAELIQEPSDDGYKLRAVYLPTSSTDNYRFRYIRDRVLKAGLRKTRELEINQAYQVVKMSDFNHDSRSEKIAGQVYPIHIGEIFGIAGRILVFISGFIPLLLLITGYRFFRIRKKVLKEKKVLYR